MSRAGNIWVDASDPDKSHIRAYLNAREFLSVKDPSVAESTPGALDGGAVGDGVTDDTAACTEAMGTKETVLAPAGEFKVSEPLKLQGEGQELLGVGRYTNGTKILWAGTDATKNIIEFSSNRRDGSNLITVLRAASARGFYVSTASGSECANMIWVEDGNFHTLIESIYMQVFNGEPPTGALIKLVSGDPAAPGGMGYSYPVHATLRNITARGDLTNGQTAFTPYGIHLQSAIEPLVDNCFIYDVQFGLGLGDPDPDNYRNLQTGTIFHSLFECGNRDNATTDGAAVAVYEADDIRIISTKMTNGAGAEGTGTWGDGRVVRFKSKPSGPTMGIRIIGGLVWGLNECNYLYEAEVASELLHSSVGFTEHLAAKQGVLLAVPPATPHIHFDDLTNYYRQVPLTHGRFQTQGARLGSTSYNAGALTVETVSHIMKKAVDLPALGAASHNDGQPLIVQPYQRNNNANSAEFIVLNAGGSAASLTSVYGLRMREFLPDEILGMSSPRTFNPGTITNGSAASVGVVFPGAALGDFIAAGFWNGSDASMAGVFLSAHVTSAGVCAAKFSNFIGGGRTLDSGTLRLMKLNPDRFDFYGEDEIDVDSVPANSIAVLQSGGVDVTITVTGAAVGDAAACACSISQGNLAVFPVFTAASTAKLVAINGTGSAVDLGTATWKVGGYDTYNRK